MSFAVIEGLDGSGKSTQIKLLKRYLESKGIAYKYLHFPRTDEPVYGELIARFLRGELGRISEVDPYLIALMYAGDRNDAKPLVKQWIEKGNFVLVDRYVFSNIAFQCAKYQDSGKRDDLKKWILKLEYEYNCLPPPDINLFLDVPFSFTREQLEGTRKGDDRKYLGSSSDIHEADLEFQKNVREVYLSLEGDPGFRILRCYDHNNIMNSPEMIFQNIIKILFNDEDTQNT